MAWPLARFAASRGGHDPQREMDAAVQALLTRTGEAQPPIGLRALWLTFGAEFTTAVGGPPGRLEVVGGRYRIVIRADRNWRRQRFSIAHEIGHLILFDALKEDPEALHGLTDPAHWEGIERLCDAAAAQLLLPRSLLAVDLTAEPLTPERLRWLYDRYLVSWRVLLRGIAEMTEPGCVSLWSRLRRHERERFAPRLVTAFGGTYGPYLPPGMTCRHVTPDLVGRCYALGRIAAPEVVIDVRGEAVLRGPGLALPWPEPVQAPTFRGMPVPEESVRPFDVLLVVGSGVCGELAAAEPGTPRAVK